MLWMCLVLLGDEGDYKHWKKKKKKKRNWSDFPLCVCLFVLNACDHCSRPVLAASMYTLQITVLIKAAALRIAWHYFKRTWNNPNPATLKDQGTSARAEAPPEVSHSIPLSLSLDMKVMPVLWRSQLFPCGWNAIVCQTKSAVFTAPPCLHAWPALSNKAPQI